jgi:RHS repeat-associated protein
MMGAGRTTTYTANSLNQYTGQTIQYAGSPASLTIPLTHDLDGNLTNDGTYEYTYDAENRLTSVTPLNPQDGDKKVEAAYDYLSRRISKQVSVYEGGTWEIEKTITFVYDGWNLIQETTTTDSGNTTEYYVWGLDLSGTLHGAGGIGGLLSKTNDLTGTTFLSMYDANGNAGQLVDAADGSRAATYEYDPFGHLWNATGPEAEHNPFRFSTKYVDGEVGLYYYGYRYYSPELGRWVRRDPIGERGGINLYGFAGNEPIGTKDSYGLVAWEEIDRTLFEPAKRRPGWRQANTIADQIQVIRLYIDRDREWANQKEAFVYRCACGVVDFVHFLGVLAGLLAFGLRRRKNRR